MPTLTPPAPTRTDRGPDRLGHVAAPAPPPPPAAPVERAGGRGRRSLVTVALVAALSGAAAATPVAMVIADDEPAPTSATTDAGSDPSSTVPVVDDAAAALDARAVAAAVTPSVVRIDVAGAAGQGSGSGVVYRADGVVITNNHVVTNARDVVVTVPDGRELDAQVVGTYPRADLAVLRVDADDLAPVTVADGPAEIGEEVLAVGSPFGLDGSVTRGIVSANGRTVTTGRVALTNLVQTDAAINPGNSGGALVNAAGELVGINTVIATSGGGSDGIGFAIDAATAVDVADDLLDDGEVEQALLGIRGATATSRGQGASGAWVGEVAADSPAADAGLREGDVVTALDGEEVTSFEELAGRIARREPGDTVTLAIDRDDEAMEVEVTLGEAT